MNAKVLHEERAAECRPELRELLQNWKLFGTFDVVVAKEGGYRFGPIDEAKQEGFFRTGASKAKGLRDTPHGRRCAIDCHPVGFVAHKSFADQPLPGMREKFRAWGAFAELCGFVWGGRFGGFGSDGDMPHVEIRNWRTLFQFPSGDAVIPLPAAQEKKP